jgi:hypothetical protein
MVEILHKNMVSENEKINIGKHKKMWVGKQEQLTHILATNGPALSSVRVFRDWAVVSIKYKD